HRAGETVAEPTSRRLRSPRRATSRFVPSRSSRERRDPVRAVTRRGAFPWRGSGAMIGLAFAGCTGLPPPDPGCAPDLQIEQGAPATASPAARRAFGETFGLRLGGLLTSAITTETTLDVTTARNGASVGFEDELGLSSETTSFRVDGYW